jgi:hypothetical protein
MPANTPTAPHATTFLKIICQISKILSMQSYCDVLRVGCGTQRSSAETQRLARPSFSWRPEEGLYGRGTPFQRPSKERHQALSPLEGCGRESGFGVAGMSSFEKKDEDEGDKMLHVSAEFVSKCG